MRALFLLHSSAPSGAELASYRLVKQWTDVEPLVVFAKGGGVSDLYKESGVCTLIYEAPADARSTKRSERSILRRIRAFGALFRYGWRLAGLADVDQADLVIANSVKSLLYGWVTARRLSVPFVWSVHDRVSRDYFGTISSLVIRVFARFAADGFIVNSRHTASTIWSGRKPVLIMPPGIDFSLRGAPVGGELPEQTVRQVSMVGRISPWKGQLQFVDAFSKAFPEGDVRATIVGGALFDEKNYEAQVERAIDRSPARGRISLVGHQAPEVVAEILAKSDILVHASIIPEPFGAVVIEGMQAGCAVIATKPGGPAEAIRDGIDGLLVPCDDVDALASALRRLSSDFVLRKTLIGNASARARAYDVVDMATASGRWLYSLGRGDALPRLTDAVNHTRS